MAKNTKSLLHFDTNLTNSNNRNFDIIGNPQISNTESKFGKSLYLDGNSYLQTPSSEDFNFGTGDFTIEWWEYNISNSQYSNPIQIGSDHCKALLLGHYYNGNRSVFCGNIGTNNNILHTFNLGSFELNKWCHFALVRSGNTFYGFKNGVLTSTSVSNESLTFPDYKCTIGNAIVPSNPSNYKFNGYLDEVRIVKGVAKYTANFVPPTEPFIEDANTSLLLHFDEEFTNFYKDESGKEWSTVGSPALKSNISKFGSKSLYLDGNSYLSTPSSNDFNFGTEDFTIESYVYGSTQPVSCSTILSSNTNGKGTLFFSDQLSGNCPAFECAGVRVCTSTKNITDSKWHHIALTRYNGVFRLFVDGNLESTNSSYTTALIDMSTMSIGAALYSLSNTKFNGYIDEVRIIKGVAKYTANFVPPTQELSLEWNNVAYLTSDDKLYGKVGSTFTKLSDTYSAMTTADAKAAIDSTDTNTATVAELQTIGAFKVLITDTTSSKIDRNMSVVNKDTLITPKGLILLKSIEGIDKVSLSKSITGTGACRLLVTNDLITYKTFDGTNFVDIDHTDINAIKTNGIDPSVLATITREQWDTLTVGKTGIGFAYLPTIEDTSDVAYISDISMTADMKGSWDKAKEANYDYGYPVNDLLRVKINTDGSYKINYKE